MLAKTPLLLAIFTLNVSPSHFYYLMCPLHSARESYCNCGQSFYNPMIQSRNVYGNQLSSEILPEQLWIVPAEDYEAEIPAVKIAILPAQPPSEGKAMDLQAPTSHIVQPKVMPDVEVSWKVEDNNPKIRESVLDTLHEIKSEKLSEDTSLNSKEKSLTSTEESVINLTEVVEQSTSTEVIETTEQVRNTIEKSNEDNKTRNFMKEEKVKDIGKSGEADRDES